MLANHFLAQSLLNTCKHRMQGSFADKFSWFGVVDGEVFTMGVMNRPNWLFISFGLLWKLTRFTKQVDKTMRIR